MGDTQPRVMFGFASVDWQAFKANKVAKSVRIGGQNLSSSRILKSFLTAFFITTFTFWLSPQLESSHLDMFHLSLLIKGLLTS